MLTSETATKLREQAAERARRARRQIVLVVPLIVAVMYAYDHRVELFGLDRAAPAAVATAPPTAAPVPLTTAAAVEVPRG